MGIEPPFLYDAVNNNINFPYKEFDPRAVSRASLTPKPPRPKYEGPLIDSARTSFISLKSSPTSTSSPSRKSLPLIPASEIEKQLNSIDSLVPHGNTDAKFMRPSTKMVVTRMRTAQLSLRCFELLGAVGLLGIGIFLNGIPSKIGLIIRIPPGVAIIHTVYGAYHLWRRPSGRTPGSSASYQVFAACFDLSLLPFYAFSAILLESQYSKTQENGISSQGWSTLFGQALLPKFLESTFLLAVITGGLHLVSLLISVWLAVIFWKITKLPPDMNPLEDNLTSRHKKSKSASLTAAERRLSEPLESKRSSGAAYEDLLRPPTIPFHNNNASMESFSTYHSTPPPSRGSQSGDSIRDLPSRQYQIPSPRSSPRSSLGAPIQPSESSSPKRASYNSVPMSEILRDPGHVTKSLRQEEIRQKDMWFASNSLVSSKKPNYEPIAQQTFDDFEFSFSRNSLPASDRKAPKEAGNRNTSTSELSLIREESRDYSSLRPGKSQSSKASDKESFKGKYYGDLRPGTPPIMVGSKRQISTGADVGSSFKVLGRREVSGKVAEEGRGGWSEKLRRISGRA